MRVADQQMYNTLLGNLQRSRLQMLTSQEQVSSQRRVSTPEDDPSSYGQIVLDKSALSQTKQWIRNIDFGTSRVNAADQALGQVQTLITRVRELTIQASSDTTSAEGRQSIAKEVRQLQRQLVQLGNTEVAGQAVFGGTKTNVTPYVITTGDTVTYQGNTETQSIALEQLGVLVLRHVLRKRSTADRCPSERLSNTVTWCPAFNSSSTHAEPM